jgi:hypothetical protein
MLRALESEDAETERMLRNSFRWQWLAFALLLSAMVLQFVISQDGFPILMVLLGVAVVASFYAGCKVSYADGSVTSRYYLDTQHGRWRFSLVNMLLFGLIGVRHIAQFSQTHDMIALGFGVVMVLLPSASLVIGPKVEFEEEITRALRSRAMRVGYVMAQLVLAAVTAVAVYVPNALMLALAWGLFASTAVPIATYAILDWLSDRGADV